MLILSDSHGRDLCNRLSDCLTKNHVKSKYKISGFVKPNATFDNVIGGCKFEKLNGGDVVIVMAGTNNFPQHCNELHDSMSKALSQSKHTNMVIIGVPKRFDQPQLNYDILMSNKLNQKLVTQFKHATFIPLDNLLRSHFTSHGLHLNGSGKRRVAEIISKKIKSIKLSQQNVKNNKSLSVDQTFGSKINNTDPKTNSPFRQVPNMAKNQIHNFPVKFDKESGNSASSTMGRVRGGVWYNSKVNYHFLGRVLDQALGA